MTRPIALLLLATGLAGCGVYREATAPLSASAGLDWRAVATEADRERMRNWRQAWEEALPLARAVSPDVIAADSALFDPDRAQANAAPPAGTYRCRTFKLGAAGTGLRDFTAYPWFECRVTDEGEVLGLHKSTGSQRPTGLLFRDSDARLVFLGTLVLGDEASPLRYGADASRDVAGYVERIAPARWRLVMPYPRFESKLDVTELVPAR